MNQCSIRNGILGLFIMTISYSIDASQHDFVAVTTAHQAKPYFERANETSLILFDVDSTLTTPSDPYLRRHAIQQHKTIYKDLISPLSPNQHRIFNHLLVIQSPSQLLDKDWPAVIKNIQKKKSKTLAMTSAKTGPIDSILSSFPQWRFQELKRFGIDFSKTFPGSILFKNLNDFGGEHPGMEKGIIYCGHQSQKGDLLQDVLKELQFTPKMIIFVDDKMDNLTSLSEAIKTILPDTNFVGIHYKGMDILPDKPANADIFKEKFTTLVTLTKRVSH